MSAFDRFIEDAAVRLELGFRARSVVGVLVSWIASHPLGLDGLEQQFEQAGLGTRFRSWQRPAAPPLPIIASELERAIGTHALTALARKAVLPPGTFRVMACSLLPGLIGLMTPPGTLAAQGLLAPTRRNARLQRLRMTGAVPSRAMHGLALRSMLWLLGGMALLTLGAWLHVKMRTPLWVAPTLIEQSDARLTLRQYGTRVVVEGQLPTESDRRRIWNALASVYGHAHVRDDIRLQHGTRPPRWLDRLATRLPQLQGDGLVLALEGNRLQVDTTAMEASQRLAVSRLLRRDFADLHTTGLWGPGLAALAQLPDHADAVQLVDALNQTTLTFAPGSAGLRNDSADTLLAIAAALQAAPQGLVLEVGTHTDSVGTAATNLALSQQRAEAVRDALQAHGVAATMLKPVGHGQEQPVADNRSDAGRARNRRIVYSVAPPLAPQRRPEALALGQRR